MTLDEMTKELLSLMNKPPAEKSHITHALSQIRKVLEHDNLANDYWILVFFCDWMLHPKLTRALAKQFVALLDEHFRTLKPDEMVYRIVSLELLKEELWKFLRQYDLPTVWVEDDFVWQKVARFYGDQIRNTPLVINRKDYNLQYIQKAVISSLEPSKNCAEANPGQEFFGFKWDFTLNDGKEFSIPYTSNVPIAPEGWQNRGERGVT